MKLPFLISVPHAGLEIPPEAQSYCTLTHEDIIKDGDEHAADIYSIQEEVDHYVTTHIARAIVDLNRRTDDRRPDGVIKTHTCWNVPVYHPPLPDPIADQLLENYYHPYHQKLTKKSKDAILGIDCHTMAAYGPPIGPGENLKRPAICLSDGNGLTLPKGWIKHFATFFEETFGFKTAVNDPFKGGYIIQSHYQEIPWLQLEIRRDFFLSNAIKKEKIIQAFRKIFTFIQETSTSSRED